MDLIVFDRCRSARARVSIFDEFRNFFRGNFDFLEKFRNGERRKFRFFHFFFGLHVGLTLSPFFELFMRKLWEKEKGKIEEAARASARPQKQTTTRTAKRVVATTFARARVKKNRKLVRFMVGAFYPSDLKNRSSSRFTSSIFYSFCSCFCSSFSFSSSRRCFRNAWRCYSS